MTYMANETICKKQFYDWVMSAEDELLSVTAWGKKLYLIWFEGSGCIFWLLMCREVCSVCNAFKQTIIQTEGVRHVHPKQRSSHMPSVSGSLLHTAYKPVCFTLRRN